MSQEEISAIPSREPEDDTEGATVIKSTEAAESLRKINSLLGSDDAFPLEESSRILEYINSPPRGPSNSYPNIGKTSNQLMMVSDTLDTLGDIDLKDTTDTLKKVLTRTLHPVVKLYDGIY